MATPGSQRDDRVTAIRSSNQKKQVRIADKGRSADISPTVASTLAAFVQRVGVRAAEKLALQQAIYCPPPTAYAEVSTAQHVTVERKAAHWAKVCEEESRAVVQRVLAAVVHTAAAQADKEAARLREHSTAAAFEQTAVAMPPPPAQMPAAPRPTPSIRAKSANELALLGLPPEQSRRILSHLPVVDDGASLLASPAVACESSMQSGFEASPLPTPPPAASAAEATALVAAPAQATALVAARPRPATLERPVQRLAASRSLAEFVTGAADDDGGARGSRLRAPTPLLSTEARAAAKLRAYEEAIQRRASSGTVSGPSSPQPTRRNARQEAQHGIVPTRMARRGLAARFLEADECDNEADEDEDEDALHDTLHDALHDAAHGAASANGLPPPDDPMASLGLASRYLDEDKRQLVEGELTALSQREAAGRRRALPTLRAERGAAGVRRLAEARAATRANARPPLWEPPLSFVSPPPPTESAAVEWKRPPSASRCYGRAPREASRRRTHSASAPVLVSGGHKMVPACQPSVEVFVLSEAQARDGAYWPPVLAYREVWSWGVQPVPVGAAGVTKRETRVTRVHSQSGAAGARAIGACSSCASR